MCRHSTVCTLVHSAQSSHLQPGHVQSPSPANLLPFPDGRRIPASHPLPSLFFFPTARIQSPNGISGIADNAMDPGDHA